METIITAIITGSVKKRMKIPQRNPLLFILS